MSTDEDEKVASVPKAYVAEPVHAPVRRGVRPLRETAHVEPRRTRSVRPPSSKELVVEEIRKSLNKTDIEYLRSCNVMIGTPCYGCSALTSYMTSMFLLIRVFTELGIGYETMTPGNESLIPRARNSIAAATLGSPHVTHLLFIDADIGFQVEDVIRMLLRRKPVVAGVYPTKAIIWEDVVKYIAQKVKAGDDLTVGKLMEATSRYPVNVVPKTGVHDGLVEVMDIPTGFLLIEKSVLHQLKSRVPNYVNDVTQYDSHATKGNYYEFFPLKICPETQRLLSEDYSFSRICRDAGIKCYVDISVKLTHTGVSMFNGCLYEQMKWRASS